MKNLCKKYIHVVLALYLPIYLAGFFFLESLVTDNFHTLNSPIDNAIPFVSVFIIPYIMWFFYVTGFCVYFFLVSQREFVKMMSFLILGMTSYLIICYIYPNGLCNYRPAQLEPSFFNNIVMGLYKTDTSTNVFPSIHVYNSIGVHIAVSRSEVFKRRITKPASLILCLLICLSTLFLKQHALIDVLGGLVMSAIFYELVYKTSYSDFLDKHTWA